MLLSDGEILEALASQAISLDPAFEDDNHALQPASMDVRLGDTLQLFTDAVEIIDPEVHQPELTISKKIQPQGFYLNAGEFVLGTTREELTLDGQHAAMLNGKSSLGRLGLEVHSTAGWIDPGFHGTVTLEIKNVNKVPIKLRADMWIGQLLFFRTKVPVMRPYGSPGLGSRYMGQSGATASRSWM